MDHPFWESFAENSPVHFDQIAAQYVGQSNPTAKVEDMKGVPFYAFTDKAGTPLPWRNCAGPNYTPPGNGQMVFDTLSVPVTPQRDMHGDPRQRLHPGQLPRRSATTPTTWVLAVDAGASQLAGALLH